MMDKVRIYSEAKKLRDELLKLIEKESNDIDRDVYLPAVPQALGMTISQWFYNLHKRTEQFDIKEFETFVDHLGKAIKEDYKFLMENNIPVNKIKKWGL